jgi:hypothetical protein
MTTIFTGWEPRHTEMFGRYTLKLSHRLHESELFTDEALAALIEGYPDDLYNLNSMGSPEDPRFLWRRGLLGDCAGADVIAGIRAGRLWLNLRRVHEVSELYARLLDRIFAEMEANVPRPGSDLLSRVLRLSRALIMRAIKPIELLVPVSSRIAALPHPAYQRGGLPRLSRENSF